MSRPARRLLHVAPMQYAPARAMSDLDWLAHRLEQMDGDTIPLEEAIEQLPEEPQPVEVEPAGFARLLVFALDAADDAKTMGEDAERLARAMLSVYRRNVIDGRRGRSGSRLRYCLARAGDWLRRTDPALSGRLILVPDKGG